MDGVHVHTYQSQKSSCSLARGIKHRCPDTDHPAHAKVLNFHEKIHAHGFEQLHLEFKVLLLSKEYEGVPVPVCTTEHTELLSVYH